MNRPFLLLSQRAAAARFLPRQIVRGTHVFRHAKHLPATPEGEEQRPPWEKQEYQMYELVRVEDEEKTPLKVLLSSYVEEVGNWGDVVEVEREWGRELILGGQAVYPSPYNLKMFEKERKTRPPVPKISLVSLKAARLISEQIVDVPLSLKVDWIIEPWHLKVALRQIGFQVPEESVVTPREAVVGPDLTLEGTLFRFYLILNHQLLVPGIGRIRHKTGEGREVLQPGVGEKTFKEELKDAKLPLQRTLVLKEPLTSHSQIWTPEIQQRLNQIDKDPFEE